MLRADCCSFTHLQLSLFLVINYSKNKILISCTSSTLPFIILFSSNSIILKNQFYFYYCFYFRSTTTLPLIARMQNSLLALRVCHSVLVISRLNFLFLGSIVKKTKNIGFSLLLFPQVYNFLGFLVISSTKYTRKGIHFSH